ncbi:ribonuclease H [Senna tora]|uniref:Ribonuclease H n=1 Tax=Senna tora TaxID=362788 RepID=A0A834WA99_9FABA|nr:ribonuclease H [Senna tora]
MIKAQNDRSIQGVKVARAAPAINHLLYADDVLMFFKATKNSCAVVHNIVQKFGTMTGLWMNHQKSEIQFSPNISHHGGNILAKIINCRHVDHLSKYLGGFIDGPNTARRNASLILDNMQKKLAGWKAKLLSQAARTTLIKAVVSAIPIYHLQHTWLNRSQANKCDATMRKFFWGQWEETKAPPMISWTRLCAQKREGGLGFRQMSKLSEALLAKQGWRILTLERSLVSQIFMGKYRSSVENYNLTPKTSASPLWKKICQASKIVTEHMGWRVGNGEKINLYDSKWIPPDSHNHNFTTLGELMIPGGYWDREKVNQVYTGRNRSFILDTVVSRTQVEDKRIWTLTCNGEFNVKKAYQVLSTEIPRQRQYSCKWNRLWQLPLPQKIIHFWWKNLNAGLPLRDTLVRRGYKIPTTCPFGCDTPETEIHIFKQCQFAKRVWFASRWNIRTEHIGNQSMSNWIRQLLNDGHPAGQNHYHNLILPLLTICWSIYTQRNEILFQQGKADVMECLHRAYRVLDALQHTKTLPTQDPFFKCDIPRRQRRDVDRLEDPHSHHLNLFCQWTQDSVKRKKVFGIFRQHTDNPQPVCYLVTDWDQDKRLGLLRNIRNFLQSYGTESSTSITINIPDTLIANFMASNSIVNISHVTTTIARRGLSLPGL